MTAASPPAANRPTARAVAGIVHFVSSAAEGARISSARRRRRGASMLTDEGFWRRAALPAFLACRSRVFVVWCA